MAIAPALISPLTMVASEAIKEDAPPVEKEEVYKPANTSSDYGNYQKAQEESLAATRQLGQLLNERINPTPNYFNIAAGFFKPTIGGSFGESVGNAVGAYGAQIEEARKQAPSIAAMRAQIAQAQVPIEEKAMLKKAMDRFINDPTDRQAIADIAKFSPEGIKTVIDLAKSAPRVRSLLKGKTGTEEATPFDMLTILPDKDIASFAKQQKDRYLSGAMSDELADKEAAKILQLYFDEKKSSKDKDLKNSLLEQGFDLKVIQARTALENKVNPLIDKSDAHIKTAEKAQAQLGEIKTIVKDLGESGMPTAGHPINIALANLPSFIPGSGTKQKDFASAMTTLKSQAFMNGITGMQGFGSLSNAEGDKVQKAIANLDPDKMSYKQFNNELQKIQTSIDVMKSEAARVQLREKGRLEAFDNRFLGGSQYTPSSPKSEIVPTHKIGNRAIGLNPQGTGYVYVDNGEPVQ